MRAENTDELLLTRYLLGDLAEDEQVRVEDRAFMDPEYMAALEAVETDLIDAYVQGELATAERNAFERKFLVSPGRRSKVEFALALARVVAEAPPTSSGVAERRPAWLSRLNLFSAWGHALRVAGAMALLICAAGGAWLALENVSLRSRYRGTERSASRVRGTGGQAPAGLEPDALRADSRRLRRKPQLQGRFARRWSLRWYCFRDSPVPNPASDNLCSTARFRLPISTSDSKRGTSTRCSERSSAR